MKEEVQKLTEPKPSTFQNIQKSSSVDSIQTLPNQKYETDSEKSSNCSTYLSYYSIYLDSNSLNKINQNQSFQLPEIKKNDIKQISECILIKQIQFKDEGDINKKNQNHNKDQQIDHRKQNINDSQNKNTPIDSSQGTSEYHYTYDTYGFRTSLQECMKRQSLKYQKYEDELKIQNPNDVFEQASSSDDDVDQIISFQGGKSLFTSIQNQNSTRNSIDIINEKEHNDEQYQTENSTTDLFKKGLFSSKEKLNQQKNNDRINYQQQKTNLDNKCQNPDIKSQSIQYQQKNINLNQIQEQNILQNNNEKKLHLNQKDINISGQNLDQNVRSQSLAANSQNERNTSFINNNNNQQENEEKQNEQEEQDRSIILNRVRQITSNSHIELSMIENNTLNQHESQFRSITNQTFMETRQHPIKEDWINKRSSSFIVGWQILDKNGQLTELRIIILNSSKVFRFQSPKFAIYNLDEWASDIQRQIDSCAKISYRPFHITKEKEFWKNDRISLKEFENIADTGDLILFKGKSLGDAIIRSFGRSEYNHVALVLRYNSSTSTNNNNLYFFDANADYGVNIGQWKKFIDNKWYQFYDKISLRKLQIERSNEMLQQIEDFTRYAINKEYKVNLMKLFQRQSDANQDISEDPEKTFFCTELIAEVYKKWGFLPDNVSSSYYWPKDFQGSTGLKLLRGASLSEEFILDFQI